MKEFAQAFLIGGGVIGLLFSLPIAIVAWKFTRGFGGDFSTQDRLMVYAPAICCAAIIVGSVWRSLSKSDADTLRDSNNDPSPDDQSRPPP